MALGGIHQPVQLEAARTTPGMCSRRAGPGARPRRAALCRALFLFVAAANARGVGRVSCEGRSEMGWGTVGQTRQRRQAVGGNIMDGQQGTGWGSRGRGGAGIADADGTRTRGEEDPPCLRCGRAARDRIHMHGGEAVGVGVSSVHRPDSLVCAARRKVQRLKCCGGNLSVGVITKMVTRLAVALRNGS